MVEKMTHNLISVYQLMKKEIKVLFKEKEAEIIGETLTFKCEMMNHLLVLTMNFEEQSYVNEVIKPKV